MLQKTGNLYTDLADYYDGFCAEVDYQEQCDFARRAFAVFAGTDGCDYLDLACGTGQHLWHMQRHGFAVSGLDNSAEMLAQAGRRCPNAELLLCDLAAFTQSSQFDLITCFLYSLHYSYPLNNLIETLKRCHRALKPGGVLIFNSVDARGIRNERSVITRLQQGDQQLRFQSGWQHDEGSDTMTLSVSITRQQTTGGEECWRDQHCMTATTLPQMQQLLQQSGFETTLLEHDYAKITPWDGASLNAIVIAGKPKHGSTPITQ